MANYTGNSRSNYFRVKDIEAFKLWCEKRYLEPLQRYVNPRDEKPAAELFGISTDDEYGCWPDRDPETDEEFDLFAELALHLHEEDVAVLMHVGNEKLRYLCGFATAVNAAGEKLGVDLSDIYTLVRSEWGVEPTRAEY